MDVLKLIADAMKMHVELPLPVQRRQFGPGRKNHLKNITKAAYDAAHKDERPATKVSRQTYRADLRRQTKALNSETRETRRMFAERNLLERQSWREKSGHYAGRIGVAVAKASTGAGRLHRRVRRDDTARRSSNNLVRLA